MRETLNCNALRGESGNCWIERKEEKTTSGGAIEGIRIVVPSLLFVSRHVNEVQRRVLTIGEKRTI